LDEVSDGSLVAHIKTSRQDHGPRPAAKLGDFMKFTFWSSVG
jgi:hypothetical protein